MSQSPSVIIEIWNGDFKDAESSEILPANPPFRHAAGDSKLNWLLEGGSHILVIKSMRDEQSSLHVRLMISPETKFRQS